MGTAREARLFETHQVNFNQFHGKWSGKVGENGGEKSGEKWGQKESKEAVDQEGSGMKIKR